MEMENIIKCNKSLFFFFILFLLAQMNESFIFCELSHDKEMNEQQIRFETKSEEVYSDSLEDFQVVCCGMPIQLRHRPDVGGGDMYDIVFQRPLIINETQHVRFTLSVLHPTEKAKDMHYDNTVKVVLWKDVIVGSIMVGHAFFSNSENGYCDANGVYKLRLTATSSLDGPCEEESTYLMK